MAALRGRKIAVVGLGRSGLAAARACLAAGATVTVTDKSPAAAAATPLAELGARLELGAQDDLDLTVFDLVVISPGVPAFPAIFAAEASGVGVISEIELSQRLLQPTPTIAITGSNGKSTTTMLVYELLRAAGKRPFVGGNIGTPPCELLFEPLSAAPPPGVLVLEVSSFQCERIPTFRPHRAALLNVSENHLDRYSSFDDYVAAKGNLFVAQRPEDLAVVPAGDARCLAQARRGSARVITFATRPGQAADYGFTRDEIIDFARDLRFARSSIRLAGSTNAANICAALALVGPDALDPASIGATLDGFEGLAHRNVRVALKRGVAYYDDSKATSVGATVAAVVGLPEDKVVLIAGGRDKLGSYAPLVEALRDRGRAVVLIGEAADRIALAVGTTVPCVRAGSMQEAVTIASGLAREGDAVLLSPACSSFDMFRDYAHRGDEFVSAVAALAD